MSVSHFLRRSCMKSISTYAPNRAIDFSDRLKETTKQPFSYDQMGQIHGAKKVLMELAAREQRGEDVNEEQEKLYNDVKSADFYKDARPLLLKSDYWRDLDTRYTN
eukprot:TRINITY_DN597_c1_g1_i12.p1 TRINITY_DN597_c1_g1~~TRINITY_DN597_c1_g1_i12.p1  ORF type:complete len:116 (-),score=18.63 TRINITY_DN597_c1_g1_i12:195-512(-)